MTTDTFGDGPLTSGSFMRDPKPERGWFMEIRPPRMRLSRRLFWESCDDLMGRTTVPGQMRERRSRSFRTSSSPSRCLGQDLLARVRGGPNGAIVFGLSFAAMRGGH